MTIQELLTDLGLPQQEIGLLLREMKVYNEQHPTKAVPALQLTSNIDQILISQTPFIGRAIARVRNERFLDREEKFALSTEENAMLYATYKMDKYFRNDNSEAGGQKIEYP